MEEEKKQQTAEPQKAEDGQKKKKGKKKWIIALVSVLVVLGVVVGTGYGIFRHYYDLMGQFDPSDQSTIPPDQTIPPEPEDDPSLPPASEDEIKKLEEELRKNLEAMEQNSELYKTDAFNVLLIGVDSRSESMSGRSDCMILVSIDKSSKKVLMTSFLRDIYCSIPGRGNNRLNAAYAFGGTGLLKDTIKANFGITVDRCVVVNFYIVMDLVDAVGGIDLDMTADEIRVANGYIRSHNQMLGNPKETDVLSEDQAGTIHVNGNQALGYARNRYVGTDFARTERQRIVIGKCLEKIKKMGLGEISGLAEKFLPRVRTDLSEGDCATLLLMALNLGDYEMKTMAVPAAGTWNSANINGMSVLTIDFSANAQAWLDAVNGN